MEMHRLERISDEHFVVPHSKFLAGLQMLGVTPFDPDAVHAYKNQMVRSHPPSFVWRHRDVIRKMAGYMSLPALPAIIFGGASLVIGLAALITNYGLGQPLFSFINADDASTMLLWGCVNFIAGLCVIMGLGYFIDHIPFRGDARWTLDRYETYCLTRSLPDEIRDLAEKIKTTFPNIRIQVDELTQGVWVLDPFLVVTDPDTHVFYYIARWDEDGFVE